MNDGTSQRAPLWPGGHPCAHCGAPVPPNYRNREPRKFCSRTCAQRGWARQNYDANLRVPKPPHGHPCEHCGGPTPERKNGGKPRVYCSRECSAKGTAAKLKARGYQRTHRLRQYGITAEDYDALRVAQDDTCAICGRPDPLSKSGVWHVDHCHSTGRVRGLLCTKCNTGLGLFEDDAARLASAIKYLA